MNNLLAVATYGSQRVKHPVSGQMVSAYKLGYTGAGRAVLLALLKANARDVTSRHASYHYVQISGEVTVWHGYILLKVNDDELTRAESLTIQTYRPAIYRWMSGAWHELPTSQSLDYQPLTGRSGPDFNPTGMRIVSAATGEAEAATAGITVEKSQRSERDTPWWWLRGDTYPYRDVLKRWGCRWSKRQKAWYYIGTTLPDAVDQLITQANTPTSDDCDPCSVEEAAAILGMRVKDDASEALVVSDGSPRLFEIGQTIYARHDLETPAGQRIPTGTRGTITQLYNRNSTHGWSCDVDFVGIGVGWFFERELTSLEPVPGIRITRGSVVPPGAVPPPTHAEIKQALVEGGHQPEAVATNTEAPSMSDTDTAITERDDGEPKIRIIKPQLEMSGGTAPDAVISAIRQTNAEALPVVQSTSSSNGRRNLVRIPQTACGELTGSITGSVWCYGYAVHESICVYVNMGGPRMAVEAIRAKLAKGDIVNCVPWDAPSVELTAGEGNTGMYAAFTQNIPEAKFTSLILLHEQVTQHNYGGKATSFIFHVSDEQAMAQLRHHVTKLVKVPVFADWTGYLWQAGQAAMLVRKTRGAGGLGMLAIDLDADAWTRLLTGGLSQSIIRLPPNA